MIKYLQGDRARADSEKTCSEWAARWTDHDRTGANDGPEKSTTLIDPNERRPSSRRADLELVTEVPTKFRPRHADLRDVGRPPILLNRAAMGGDETPWPNSERKRTMNTTGKLRESTRDRYVQTLRQFESFLGSRNIVFVDDITKSVVESFKTWRVSAIKGKKNSRGGTGMVLDVAILHKAFQVAIDDELIIKNPVRFEGRPGHEPIRGAQPFSADELTRMQTHAKDDLLA